jgi:type I restriction enzyme, S subunit
VSGPWQRNKFQLAPLGHVADIQLGKMLQPAQAGDGDTFVSYLRAGSLSDLKSIDTLPEMYASPEDLQRYHVVTGDLVVAEGGDCGQTAFVPPVPSPTIIQNSLHRVRSSTSDIRFIRYSLDAIYSSGWLDVLCSKSTFGHLTREKLVALPVPSPPPVAQSRIADYLDHETERIDSLIAARRHMVVLLEEHVALAFDCAVRQRGFEFPAQLDPDWAEWPRPKHWAVMRLSRVLVQLTNGFVGPTRDILRDDGVPYIQSLHIKNGRIDFERCPFFVEPQWHEARPRIHLREEDVLIVQTGDIGQVAVVPPHFGAASCHALQIARVKRALISGSYLAAYLRSPFGRHSLLSRATGALHPHLEAGIKSIPVVVPPLDAQEGIVEEVAQAEVRAAGMLSILHRQAQLLQERRHALVTAAVTGQLDTLGAA